MRRHRFPIEIISHCVWLDFRFSLSLRDVEEMFTMRGVSLSYETVREWSFKFGQTYASGLRHKSHRPDDHGHLDFGMRYGWPKRERYSGDRINDLTISAWKGSPFNWFSLPSQKLKPAASGLRLKYPTYSMNTNTRRYS